MTDYVIGFAVAMFIALTGVGAGTITVPVLVLFLGVPAAEAVAIGLMFSAVIKLVLVPAQVARGNVAWRTLGVMVMGGAPGVLLGSLALSHLVGTGSKAAVNGLLGVILIATAGWQIAYSFRTPREAGGGRDRRGVLGWLMLPVGLEVGFSSAGAGALGSAALLGLTTLAPAQVVGTDIVFGFLLSLLGSGAHGFAHGAGSSLLWHLIAGGVLGAGAGTMLSTVVPRRPLRFALWVWLMALGGQFLFSSIAAR